MKKVVFLIFVILVSFSLGIKAQWQTDVRLTNAPDTSRTSIHNSNIALNGNNLHIVWYDKRDGNYEIYYKRSTDSGLSWSTDARLTNNAESSLQPSCAANGSVVHVAWCDNRSGTFQVYYKCSSDAGFTWSVDTCLSNTTMSTSFNPHLSASGLLMFIVWYDNRDGNLEVYYKRSTNGGISWGADTRLTNNTSNSSSPAVAISGSNVHVVWYDIRDGNYEIYYKRSTDAGITWDADTRLTIDPASSQVPDITVSGSNVYTVWYDMRAGNWEIYYKSSSDNGINWGPDIRLTNDLDVSSVPSVAVSGSNVHVVWTDLRDFNWEVYYKLSTDGGVNWSADTRLTNESAESYYPSLSISDSFLHLIWMDFRDGNFEIYYKRNPTGNPIGMKNTNSAIPREYSVSQNYPNPFNPKTIINFQIPKNSFVTLKIYDLLGREVTTLVNKELKAGTFQVDWDGSNFSSGMYFYKFTSDNYSETKRMILVK